MPESSSNKTNNDHTETFHAHETRFWLIGNEQDPGLDWITDLSQQLPEA